jgi:hypothetical protein
MYSSIGWGPRLMKRRSLVRISLPLLCGHVKKKNVYEMYGYNISYKNNMHGQLCIIDFEGFCLSVHAVHFNSKK